MKIVKHEEIKKFQQGGNVPDQQQPAQSQDPVMELANMAGQAIQGQDCEMAMGVCQGYLMLVEQMMGGAEQQAPMGEAPQGEPVFKRGGKLVGRKGCKMKSKTKSK